MRYTEEMILRSSSGYCMPFEEPTKQDVQMSLGYGEQKHPVTGETFFHHGIDFSVNHYLLSAVQSFFRPGGHRNRVSHRVGRGAWHLPDHPLRQIRSDLQTPLQCLRQLLPKRQGRSDHCHQWRHAAHGGEV